MILAAVIAISLVTTVAVDERTLSPSGAGITPNLSVEQKGTALRRLIRSATECVVRTVSADPRLSKSVADGDVTLLIVDSMSACVDDVRAMIDAHDRLYGDGSGEAFFMGPYLDNLPATIGKAVQ